MLLLNSIKYLELSRVHSVEWRNPCDFFSSSSMEKILHSGMGSAQKLRLFRKFLDDKWVSRGRLSDKLDCLDSLRSIDDV